MTNKAPEEQMDEIQLKMFKFLVDKVNRLEARQEKIINILKVQRAEFSADKIKEYLDDK
jgi:hypothetical protein